MEQHLKRQRVAPSSRSVYALIKELQDELTRQKVLTMYGSANAAWVPCSTGVWNVGSLTTNGYIQNVGAGDAYICFDFPLPTVKGSYKLYVCGVAVPVVSADVNDFVDMVRVAGLKFNAWTAEYTHGDNISSAGKHEHTFNAVDMSAYDSVQVYVQWDNTDALQGQMNPPLVKAYYA